MAASRYIIRVANTDLNGEKQIAYALCKVKGISIMLAQAICNVAGIEPSKKAGDLTEAEEKHLNDLLKDLPNSGIPQWMLNRRKDPETGEDMHLIGSDVAYVKENDIKFLRKIRTYKGLRHAVGLPVRGQRTKSNFRKNKTRGSSKRKK